MTIPAEVLAIPPDLREKVRARIGTLEANNQPVNNRTIKKLGGGGSGPVAALLRAYKAGTLKLGQSWGVELEAQKIAEVMQDGDPATLATLVVEIRNAETPGDLVEVSKQTVELNLLGMVSDARAKAIKALITEQRLSMDAQAKIPTDDPEKLYLLSEDGALLVSVFERIVSDERRARALVALGELLEEDVRELPAVDPVGEL